MLSRWPCARRGSGTSASAASREANGTVATSTKLEGHLYRSVTSGPPPLTPRVGGSGRYSRTEWPCPAARRSDAVPLICSALEGAKLKLSDDVIRNKLDDAARLV